MNKWPIISCIASCHGCVTVHDNGAQPAAFDNGIGGRPHVI